MSVIKNAKQSKQGGWGVSKTTGIQGIIFEYHKFLRSAAVLSVREYVLNPNHDHISESKSLEKGSLKLEFKAS